MVRINNRRKKERVTFEIMNNNGFNSYSEPMSGFNSDIKSCLRPYQVAIKSIRFRIDK